MAYAPPRKRRTKPALPKPGRPAFTPHAEANTPPRPRIACDAGVEGVTEALMLAHGFTIELMVALCARDSPRPQRTVARR